MDGRLRHFRRGLRLLVVNPLAMAAALILLWLEVERLRGYDGVRERSLVMMLLHDQDQPPEGTLEVRRQIYIVREEPAWRYLEPDRESWDEATRVLLEQPEDVLTATYLQESFTQGWLHPTRRHEAHALGVEVEFGGAFSAAQLVSAREGVLAHLGVGGRAASTLLQPDEAGEADVQITSLLPRGYLLNIYLAFLIGVLGYSLLWIPAFVRAARGQRYRRAVARGRCPHCGYDLRRVEHDTCPECGRKVQSEK